MTALEFWNNNSVSEIFVAGNGCPGGQTFTHDTDTDNDEDYCDLTDVLYSGLIRTQDGPDGWQDLNGTVADGVWTWDGDANARDSRGNNYQQIQFTAG